MYEANALEYIIYHKCLVFVECTHGLNVECSHAEDRILGVCKRVASGFFSKKGLVAAVLFNIVLWVGGLSTPDSRGMLHSRGREPPLAAGMLGSWISLCIVCDLAPACLLVLLWSGMIF